MQSVPPPARIHRRLVDSLYVEAMLLADDARAYFDGEGREQRDALDAVMRVSFSCEALKVTTRLMHVIAWLLTQRAVDTGELAAHEAATPARRLGSAPLPEMAVLAAMPARAVALVEASRALYERVERLDAVFDEPAPASSPAHRMINRLRGAL